MRHKCKIACLYWAFRNDVGVSANAQNISSTLVGQVNDLFTIYVPDRRPEIL